MSRWDRRPGHLAEAAEVFFEEITLPNPQELGILVAITRIMDPICLPPIRPVGRIR